VFDLFGDPVVKSYFKDSGNEYHVKSAYKKENPKKKNAKKTSFVYISFDDKFSLTLSESGVVQVKGVKDIDESYGIIKKFFMALKNNDFLITSGANQNTQMKAPKNTKVARRLNNMPAPDVTRRGTTCPVGRRPDPYSYEGKCSIPGCYIKPNPQGQPCCYTIPKSIKYSQNKVENAYRKAGVKVPNAVRKEFGIGFGTNNRPVNVANKAVKLVINTRNNAKSGFMINSRQCLRYTKVGLVDIARRLKIHLPGKLTKPILCTLIKEHSKNAPKKKAPLMSGNNKNFRLVGRRCDSYPRQKLVKFAEELGAKVPETHTKEQICKTIRMFSKKLKTDENVYNYIEKFSGKNNNDEDENFRHFMKGPKASTS
jgi:hypothetical protein